jgi:molybdenum cofactor guanylyltransferase
MNDVRIVGAILAGGEGQRIGGAKALIDLAGEPLIAHVARALRGGVTALAVVGDAFSAELLGAEGLSDPVGVAQGPLAGVLAALEWAERSGAAWLATAPCDTPFLPRDVVQQLAAGAAASGALIVCAETPDGAQPMVALWRSDLAASLRVVLQTGKHPAIHRLLDDFGASRVSFDGADFVNVNTPEDLARARALLAPRG